MFVDKRTQNGLQVWGANSCCEFKMYNYKYS